jgi:SPP1 family predicted phage head-tail adaptor
MALRAGTLDRQVVIEVRSLTADGAGQMIETWATLVTVWMRILPQPGGERFAAQQVIGRAVTTFQARWRAGLTVHNHRLNYDGKRWDIQDIRELGRQEGVEIDAAARAEA